MGGTDCGEFRVGLGVYALGRLPGAEADELSAHLRGCPPCRAELADLRDVARILRRGVRERRAAPGTRLSGACACGPRGSGRSR
ncbi:anti-sigma factor family protein [Actinomadura pelletieri]|uniref:anti-sigma factor family protein n=1 Tax=Actinomadura pelletieri TaxID=111805 RepID=UPI000EAC4E67|nr:zf-HC2 domain-containing protein [Actinomadura pelletieri]